MFTKQATTFRLSKDLLTKLDLYAKTTGSTKTSLLEKALESYINKANKVLPKKRNNLIKYIGGFEDQSADQMIENIRLARKNKKLTSLS